MHEYKDPSTIRTIIFSFIAGIILMGGIWLSMENQEYFAQNAANAKPSNESNQVVETPPPLNPVSSENIIAKMVNKAGPAVVKIETKSANQQRGLSEQERDSFFREFFGYPYPIPDNNRHRESLGSGFIIRENGYILTNHHVVESAQTIQVFITGYEEPLEAKIIGADPELDLAVLKVKGDKPFPYLKLGNSDTIQVGEWSVAIGNPFGLDHSVTVGVISAKGRPLTIGNQHFKNLLQTDASINPGNSGGPLLNLNGEVIGINTAINAEGQGLGFAIPINTVQEVLNDLIEKGKVSRPWLGVSIQDMTKELANYFHTDIEHGAIIVYVAEDSPAEKAGLKQGDIILEIAGEEISNSQMVADVISKGKIGERIKLLIWRDGNLHTATVTIEEKMYNRT